MNTIILSNSEFEQHLRNTTTYYQYLTTAAGILQILATDKGIFKAIFVDHETELPNCTKSNNLKQTLILVSSPFNIKVWLVALKTPAGKTTNYTKIAHHLQRPNAFRAVANALGKNTIAYFIPCHRVLRSDGDVGGYKWGVERKIKLLESEGASLKAPSSIS